MSTDDVTNVTVVMVTNEEVELYMVNTDERSDLHSEMVKCPSAVIGNVITLGM